MVKKAVPQIMFSVRLPVEIHEKLLVYCDTQKVSKTAALIAAINLLEKPEEK